MPSDSCDCQLVLEGPQWSNSERVDVPVGSDMLVIWLPIPRVDTEVRGDSQRSAPQSQLSMQPGGCLQVAARLQV